MVRSEATHEASLAAMRDLKRFGMAMAAMIKMMATTISNSISEKPFSFLISVSLVQLECRNAFAANFLPNRTPEMLDRTTIISKPFVFNRLRYFEEAYVRLGSNLFWRAHCAAQ